MSTEFSSLKVVDLKKELRTRGLPISGTKDELIARLRAYKEEKLLNATTDASEESEMDLADNIMEDIDEGVLESDFDENEEDEVLKKPLHTDSSIVSTTVTVNKNIDENCCSSKSPAKQQIKKKVVLVRKTSVPLLGTQEKDENLENTVEPGEIINNPATHENGEKERKIVKIKTESTRDRLALRAKKFGVPVIEDRKAARAARFGIQNSTSSSSSSLDTKVEVLKNRAERFGAVVSSSLSKQQFEEKLRARKARFGLSQPLSDNYEDRKKFRAEKFKN